MFYILKISNIFRCDSGEKIFNYDTNSSNLIILLKLASNYDGFWGMFTTMKI
jgi:hypothetical protein